MAIDQSALLELREALKAAGVDDRIRVAAQSMYQALIDIEEQKQIGAPLTEGVVRDLLERAQSGIRGRIVQADAVERDRLMRGGKRIDRMIPRVDGKTRIREFVVHVIFVAHAHGHGPADRSRKSGGQHVAAVVRGANALERQIGELAGGAPN